MTQKATTSPDDLHAVLGIDQPLRRNRWWLRLAGIAVLLGIGAAVWVWRDRARAADAPRYRTVPARLGDLVETVTATGTLAALDTVDVGPEVSGRILVVHADFNDEVRRGQPLVTLETDQASARLDQANAQLTAARAAVSRAEATAQETAQNLARADQMRQAGLVAAADYDSADAAARRAVAEVESARAQATVSAANLAQARTDLGKTVITSPIDGIVLSRAAEVGQNVAASFQPPILFTLARDLRAMELRADVDEADVGKVHEGQPASFTVDAYPDRTFRSRLLSLRNVAKVEQNVVTYEAVLAVENPDRLLRPGMTATAEVVVDEKRGVLLVPNAALRFTPPDVAAAEKGPTGVYIPGLSRGRPPGMRPERRQAAGATGQAPVGGAAAGPGGPSGERTRARDNAIEGRAAPAAGGRSGAPAEPGAVGPPPGSAPPARRDGSAREGGGVGARTERVVWVLRAGQPVAVRVATGSTDGTETEVRSDELAADDPVIVDVVVTPAGAR